MVDRAAGGTAVTVTGGLTPSHGQERLWFLHQLDPLDAAYNIPLVLRLTGDLSVPALTAAFEGTVARHESLRTRFPDVDGRPVAVVDAPGPVAVETVDLRGRPGSAERLLAERTNGAFDLAGARSCGSPCCGPPTTSTCSAWSSTTSWRTAGR